MNSSMNLVVYSALLTWVTIIIAFAIRTRVWTPAGFKLAAGNRENMSQPSPLSGRADRAEQNTLTNFALFAVIAIVAERVATDIQLVESGAILFFWARVAYVPVYLIGIPYVRTLTWLASVIGMGMIVWAILSSSAM